MKKLNIGKLSAIDARQEHRLSEGIMSGSAVIIYQGNEKIYDKCFGLADIESGKVLDDSALFRLASMTKAITAVAVMILVERGLISLEDRVDKYLPQFSDMLVIKDSEIRPAKSPMLIRQLLSHSSGMCCTPAGYERYAKQWVGHVTCLADALKIYPEIGLDFEPGSAQAYSGIAGFDILAGIVEVVSGKSYEEFLKENIFLPLGMTDTGYTLSEADWHRVVTMYSYTDGRLIDTHMDHIGFPNFPERYPGGGAGLISSAHDYIKFARMLLGGGQLDGIRILKEETVNLMATPALPSEYCGNSHFNWGLSFFVRVGKAPEQVLPVSSYGWSGAFGTHFWIDPVNDIACVYMYNRADAGGSGSPNSYELEADLMSALE